MSGKLENEISVEGFANGKRLTLDAIPVDTESGGSLPIVLPRRRVETSLLAGLRQQCEVPS